MFIINQNKLKKNSFIFFISGMVAGFLNGLLGTGGGIILVTTLQKLKIETKQCYATSLSITLILSVISSVFYIKNGFVNISDFIPFLLPSIIGGFIGAVFLKKISSNLLKVLFAVLLIVGGTVSLFK